MKYLLWVILWGMSSFSFAQEGKLAIINDPDGFTFVRNGPGRDNLVVDTLLPHDFFFFAYTVDSEWAQISGWKGTQVEGFVHKSRIQEVQKLNYKKQKQLLTTTLNERLQLENRCEQARINNDTLLLRSLNRESSIQSDSRYDPALSFLPDYFCKTKDLEILNLFFNTMWADAGSANEMPTTSFGKCFQCSPDVVLQQLRLVTDAKKKKFLLDHLETGLLFCCEGDTGYQSLKRRIDAERESSD